MLEFFVQRAAISAVTLFVISLVVFAGVRMIPGDPARVMAGTDADEAGLAEIRDKYGLNDAVPLQYVRWLRLAIAGDLGESIRTREPVIRTVGRKPIARIARCIWSRSATAVSCSSHESTFSAGRFSVKTCRPPAVRSRAKGTPHLSSP